MTLADVKTFLRIDSDNTADDDVITRMMASAKIYLESSSGKKYDDTNSVMNSFVLARVKAEYENDSYAMAQAESYRKLIAFSSDFAERDAT